MKACFSFDSRSMKIQFGNLDHLQSFRNVLELMSNLKQKYERNMHILHTV